MKRIILGCLLPICAFAHDFSNSDPNCLLLGFKPSLIVKFKNATIKNDKKLNKITLQKLSNKNAIFSNSVILTENSYVLFFVPKNTLLSAEILPGCYSKKSIEDLIIDFKKMAILNMLRLIF